MPVLSINKKIPRQFFKIRRKEWEKGHRKRDREENFLAAKNAKERE
jgi:hypothetical protein